MGNVLQCIGKPTKKEKHGEKKEILLSPQDSLVNNTNANSSSMSFLSINQCVNTNLKAEFNWSRIQSIYLGFNTTMNDDLRLTLPMIKTVEKLFDVLESNLLRNSRMIFLSTFLGKNYLKKFEECAELSTNDFHINNINDRMLAHIISMVKLHRVLLCAFESDVKEAQELLDLIGLSHLVMNVSPSDFKMLDIAFEKYLLKFQIIDDETLKIVITYFSLITNYICNYIEQNKNHSLVNEMLSPDIEATDKRRENLRHLRKWRALVEKIRLETSTYIEEIVAHSADDDVPLEMSKSFKFKTQCPLSHIQNIYKK